MKETIQQAITLLMQHADGDFVSKKDALQAGTDLHNLMVTTNEWENITDILNEVNRAESKHPNWPNDTIYGMAIISEECGEAMREAVKIEMNEDDADVFNLRKESIHTAATCIRMLKNL